VLYQGIAALTFERSFQLACKGRGREPAERARDSGGDEASLDPDRKLQQAPRGQSDQVR
jgi:hypothetical protein